jgi:hypothetical protein
MQVIGMYEYGFVENQDIESLYEISEKPQDNRLSTDHGENRNQRR